MILSHRIPDIASKRNRPGVVCWKSLWLVFFPFLVSACWGQSEFADKTLEQLMNVEVTSVSKKGQKLSKAAAAVFVITQEDIRHSGATSIPDLLRVVPGVQVLRIDANTWAVSIRGFNTRYVYDVLVLVDGRTVYTPTFSGVYWDHQDVPLEDIDRIEVIRGPGATVWGANAVNGVINIITKSSKATNGGLVSVGGGSAVQAQGLLQYGGRVGDRGSYRAFGKGHKIGDMPLPSGMSGNDGWNHIQGGFRSDWDLTPENALVVEGDLFSNHEGQTRLSSLLPSPLNYEFRQDFAARGGNILGRWTHQLSGGSEFSLQAYYDGYHRTEFGVEESVGTFDFDFQYHTQLGERHDVVWGAGYRRGASSLSPGHQLGFDPPSRADTLFSAFVQDEIKLAHSLWFTIGSRFEHNSYGGFEYEPSIRLAWTPTPKHTLWASVARAIRQPARVEMDLRDTLAVYPGEDGVTTVVTQSGNPKFKAEQLRQVDAGYRSQITPTLSLDVDAYYGHYRDLESYGQLPATFVPAPQPTITIPMYYANQANAINCGGELSLNWEIFPRWQISPGYSLSRLIMRNNPGSTSSYDAQIPERTPKHMFQVRSHVNLTRRLDFDNSLYWIEKMPGLNIGNQARVDSQIAWRLGEATELSVVGQNLLRPRRLEFGDSWGVAGTQVQRSIYGQIRWHF